MSGFFVQACLCCERVSETAPFVLRVHVCVWLCEGVSLDRQGDRAEWRLARNAATVDLLQRMCVCVCCFAFQEARPICGDFDLGCGRGIPRISVTAPLSCLSSLRVRLLLFPLDSNRALVRRPCKADRTEAPSLLREAGTQMAML